MQGFNEKQLDQMVSIIQKQVKELESADGWAKIADGKVIGYTKKSNSNSVISRAETIIDSGMEKIIEFFQKNDSFQKINDMCILNKLVHQKNGKYKVFYTQMKTPFPLDNRDIVTLSTSMSQGNKYYIGVKSCNYPVQKPGNFVRANMKISAWVFEKIDNYRTRITSFADTDPMGNIPDFVKQKMATRRVEIMQKLQGTLKKNGV